MTISPEDIAAARLQMIHNARTFADLLESMAPEILADGERQQAYNDGFDSGFGTANDGYGPPEELTDAIEKARAEGERQGRFIKLSDRERLRGEGALDEHKRVVEWLHCRAENAAARGFAMEAAILDRTIEQLELEAAS